MAARERMLRTSPRRYDESGSRTSWWLQECPKHGIQGHLSYIGGACEKCQTDRLSGAVSSEQGELG